ncbi:ECF transporter S component|uniref:Uncharacterized membrane protein n=1 Tax=Dendrosporobacter quercicolus TaxID=146817 RepID=A0A1H0A1N0_9FIRM|nr:ECF transporter S component [Dendrosporobacter quercicolus]NSL50085.1 ECF transporter S component [Dendrosporobacter quercicolus DSM 1736]SDN26576.1 Uncharacterized membrane protein [Dendrosporobacter quercicolus]
MEKRIQHKSKVRKMAVVGMLSAICVILGLTGYGFIPLPMAKATIMHIPVIIGALLEGPAVGLLIGLIFGLFSIFQNMAAPNLLSFAFINPLVSVLPRVLIALTAYYSYRLLSGRREFVAIGLGAAIGSLTNTIGVLGMIYLLYAADFAAARGINPDTVFNVIASIAVMNGLPEALVSVLITIPVVVAVRKVK